MADQWYYSEGGKQSGPVALDQLKQMLSSGRLSSDELVWNASMKEWTPARQVPGLTTTSSHTVAPGGSLLTYEAPGMEALQATPRSIELLRQTRPWVRLVSVLLFIGVGLNVLVATVFAGIGLASQAGVASGMIMFPYLAISILYFFPAIYLWRYAGHIVQLQASHRSEDLEAALSSQKSFWKFIGILIMVGFCIAAVGIVIGIVGGMLLSVGR